MNQLLNLKRADLIIQLLALVLPLCYCAIHSTLDSVLAAYFILGTVQGTSCIVNLFLPKQYRSGMRIFYTVLVLLIAVVSGIGFMGFLGVLGLVGVGLMYISPVFAAWYFIITIIELRNVTNSAPAS